MTTPRFLCLPFIAGITVSLLAVLVGCAASSPGDVEDVAYVSEAITGGTTYSFTLPLLTGSCVDVSANSTLDGANVQEYHCNGTTAQNWVANDQGNGYFCMRHQFTSECLNRDTSHNNSNGGGNVQQWNCQYCSSPEFQWQFQPLSGFNQLVNKFDGRCLDVAGANTADGTNIQTWSCNGTNAQTYKAAAFKTSFSTWYCGNACGMNDLGSCGTTFCGTQVNTSTLGAALSLNRMNAGGQCGRRIEIVDLDLKKSIVVPVIDACVACNTDDHVDLTLATWNALGEDACKGTFNQQWRFVD